MKKILTLLLLLESIVFSSCIKDLEERGIYETTRCYGIILDSRTGQPLADVRIEATNHTSVDEVAYSELDGTFEIPIQVQKLSSNYYIRFNEVSRFQSFEIKVSELKLGMESYDLGSVYVLGAVVPSVRTVEPENITTTSAHCVGVIDDFGQSEITKRGFVFSTMQYPTVNNTVVCVSSIQDTFAADLTLAPHSTYYIRAFAVNGRGIGYGNQVVVTTQDGLPVVETGSISNLTTTSAVCGGRVVGDGGFPITACGVCWSTVVNPTVANFHSLDSITTDGFLSELHSLHPGTTYYVRAYAQNEAGISYGANQQFTTLSGLPTVSTAPVGNVTATSAQAGGCVVSDGGFPVLRRGICFDTVSMPTIASRHTADGIGLGDYVSQMTGLSSGTTYYFRAYATSGVGTVYGSQYVFVTE